jgi:hypothetical protein
MSTKSLIVELEQRTSMSKQRVELDTWGYDQQHREKRTRKLEKILMLRALLEMYENNPDADHDYVLGLRARLRSAENQLAAMKL